MAFDLSKVLFITTANILDTVPPPLRDDGDHRDRGYTEEEKSALREPSRAKQVTDHGMVEGEHVQWTDAALRLLIRATRAKRGCGASRVIAR